MSANEKVYVIDPVSKSTLPGKTSSVYKPDESAGGGESPVGRRDSTRSAKLDRLDEKGSPALAFLSYFAGPLSILATRRGRRSRLWISAAGVSCAAAAAIALRAHGVIPGARGAFGTGDFLWLVGACLAAFLGFTAWARGVFLIGRCRSPLIKRLPGWMRHPAAALLLGHALPGLGHFAAGRTRRAPGARWTGWVIVVALAVLPQASGLWRWNLAGGMLTLPAERMELVLLAIAALGSLGSLAWLVQALDGARLAERLRGVEARSRGDLAALALLVAIAAFITMFEPAVLARNLDLFSAAASDEGMRIIPLHASTAAMRLDPSRPEYTLRAAALNESLGRIDRAEALRKDLAARWAAYARMRGEMDGSEPYPVQSVR
jgi:hypothetical protein